MKFRFFAPIVCAVMLGFFTPGQAQASNTCSNAVQNKVAWNYDGNNRWAQSNIDTLCKGAEDVTGPAECFQKVMHGRLSYSGNDRWGWQEVSKLCKGAVSTQRRISCMVGMASSGRSRSEAISACNSVGGRSQFREGPVVLEGGIIPRYEAPKPTTLTLRQNGVYLANWSVETTTPGYLPAVELQESNVVKGAKRKIEIAPDVTIVRVKANMVGIGSPKILHRDVKSYGCITLTGSVFSQDWKWTESC